MIKLQLFKLIDQYLNELFKKEVFHQQTTSTDNILQYELSRLNEDFMVDTNLDLILNTELSDMSYHQHDQDPQIHLYEDKACWFINTFEIEELISKQDTPKLVHQFYNWLPTTISNIVDLYVFGHLIFKEIATIME